MLPPDPRRQDIDDTERRIVRLEGETSTLIKVRAKFSPVADREIRAALERSIQALMADIAELRRTLQALTGEGDEVSASLH